MKTLKEILLAHIRYRSQIVRLAKSDLIKTYRGAVLGWLWAIVKPAITIFVYYFAFSVGLRTGRDVDGCPYFLWLITGMVPWFYISAMYTGGAYCIRKYSFLVTKIRFPVCTVPAIVGLSQMFVHVLSMAIVAVLFVVFGRPLPLQLLQLPLYWLLMMLLAMAWALFAGLLSVISKDFLQLVRSSNMALLWFSGIFYNVSNIGNPVLRRLLRLNPITILVDGFRDCFISGRWFWQNLPALRDFAVIYALLLAAAVWMYKRTARSIADIL